MERPGLCLRWNAPRVRPHTGQNGGPCGERAPRKRLGNCHNRFMFFRRRPAVVSTPYERLGELRQAGFETAPQSGNITRVSRAGCAIDLIERDGQLRPACRAGKLIGSEIGVLVDGGFQKFFRAPSGARVAAAAGDLRALHDFEEDLKECLGQESYYNESLGTVSTYYQYDRVKDRDNGVPKRAWE